VIDALFTLLRIHLIIILWVFCCFGFLALVSISIYLLLHYLYRGEQGDPQKTPLGSGNTLPTVRRSAWAPFAVFTISW
jgi:hypothetical protein